jgi:alpha-N-arabinofuranosidase
VVSGKEYIGYAMIAQTASKAPVEVTLRWGDAPNEAQTVRLEPGPTYRKMDFRFKAGRSTDDASLSITLTAPGCVWLGCLSLMPANNLRGMRPDTLDLIKQIAPTIVRWPGGNFVSGYNWRDGIGERDRRPPRWERAWNDIEDNDFGLDEFMDFCREVKTEPHICVNTGLGGARDAAEEVEYANGSVRTPMGSLRAANGHARPYGVVWWGVGNEMFGDWQLGHVPVERYADRHNAFVAAMRERDPGIKIIAVGAPGPWNDVILGRCAGSMDLLSGHHYSSRDLRMPLSEQDLKTYAERFPAYSASVAEGVRNIVNDFRRRLGKGNKGTDRIRLAVDEWGIVRDWNPAPDGPGIGSFEHYYCLGDAIAAARGINEILRNADVIEMANWAQLVNVIAAIKTSRTDVAMDPVGYMLAVYGGNLRGMLVPVEGPANVPLDVVAARDPATGELAVAIVNYSLTEDMRVELVIPAGVERSSLVWQIHGRSFADTNVPGQPEKVTLRPTRVIILPGTFDAPRHSITVVRYSTGKKG